MPLPNDRELLHRMLDETTERLSLYESLWEAHHAARTLREDPAYQDEHTRAARDLLPMLNGRSFWAAAADIEGRYPTFDRMGAAVRRGLRLAEGMGPLPPLTRRYVELPDLPDDVQQWLEDPASGVKMLAHVAAVQEAQAAILAKLDGPKPINYAAVAERLRDMGHAIPAALVLFMAEEKSATAADVAFHVHGDADLSGDTVRRNVQRTSKELLPQVEPRLSIHYSREQVTMRENLD